MDILEIIKNKNLLKITGDIINFEKRPEALCNKVYTLYCKNGRFIIKIAQGKFRQDELNKEVSLLETLKNCLLVPRVILYSCFDKYSFLLMEFVDGIKPKIFNDDILKNMALNLKKIHTVYQSDCYVDFDQLINICEKNIKENRLDINEFVQYKDIGSPIEIIDYLKSNKPIAKSCLLHGDFRPKNMIVSNNDLYILDWGLSFYGDFYYDLAIIKYYLTSIQFEKFCKFYGLDRIDEHRIKYNELLSLFLNV